MLPYVSQIKTKVSKTITLIYYLSLLRGVISFMKFPLSPGEALFELLSTLYLFTALQGENPYRCSIYIVFAMLEVLYTWIGLVRLFQPSKMIGFSFKWICQLLVSNLSVVLYITTIYFVYLAVQDMMAGNPVPGSGGVLIGGSLKREEVINNRNNNKDNVPPRKNQEFEIPTYTIGDKTSENSAII